MCIFNAKDLKYSREAEPSMQIHYNGVIVRTNFIGDLQGNGVVCCFYKNGIAKILKKSDSKIYFADLSHKQNLSGNTRQLKTFKYRENKAHP